MPAYRLGPESPDLADDAWIAPGAHVIGRVKLAAQTGVWFGAVIRGDNDPISIGERSNIQDGAVLHTDLGSPLTIGAGVTVGHQAMLHSCTIGDDCLIGMQAVILNRAVIGRESLVGAGALVTEDKVFPERSLIIGSPAKAVRSLTDEEVGRIQRSARIYVEKAARYRNDLREE